MSVFDDFERLKKTGLPQITAVFGEENDIIGALRDRLFDFVQFDSADLGQAYFDLSEDNADAALEELESLPFFGDKRLVIFENLLNLTTTRKSVFDEKQLARFERFLSAPLETTQLVLIFHGKLDARLKLTKKLKKMAASLEAKALTPQELQRLFSDELPSDLLRRVFEKSNFAYAASAQNIALVKSYVGGRSPTLDDVERVVPKSLQDNIFDLTNLVFTGQIKVARELVADLTVQGEDIIKILVILTNSFRLYTQVKLMQKKGWSEQQQTDFLKIHPYRVKLANQAVRRLDADYLKQALAALIRLDYQIKTGVADKDYLFDLAIIKLSKELAQT